MYKELAEARDWQPWLTAAKVVLPPGRPGALQPGDGFTYTAKFVPGFVSAKVGAAVDGQARRPAWAPARAVCSGAHAGRSQPCGIRYTRIPTFYPNFTLAPRRCWSGRTRWRSAW